MSREAFDRVRKALEGTTLAGQIERLNAELHLTPGSPEWTIAALAIIGSQPLSEELRKASASLQNTAESVPDAMKAAAGEILRGIRPQLEAIVRETAEQTRNAAIDAIGARTNEFMEASAEHLGRTLGVFENRIGDVHAGVAKVGTEAHRAGTTLDGLASWMQRERLGLWRVMAISALVGLIAGSGATGFPAWYFTQQYAFRAGYAAGAQVERSAHGWRQR